ncbi:MAG: TRAP transporter small permease [Clostridia bacterium]|nr:TRAP transporter small permease [Clostridia bacterium]
MHKASELINKFASYVVMVAAFVMTVIVIIQVSCRYFLGFSIFWSEELARYLLVWITFLGGSVAFKHAQLASINFVTDRLPEKLRAIVSLVAQLIILGFLITATVYGFKQSFAPSVLTQVSPALRMPMMYNYLAVPISFGVMCIHCLDNLFKELSLAINGGGKA